MLRLVLLMLYLMASSSMSPQTKQGGSADPLGRAIPPQTDGGGGIDPLGLHSPPSHTDQGGSADPLG